MTHAEIFLTVCKWLACAAAFDWLVGRMLLRAAIHMPKAPPVLALYQILGGVSQFAFVLTGVLALAALGILIFEQRHTQRGALSFVLGALAALSLAFVFIPPFGWWSVAYHLLALAAIVLIGLQARHAHNLRAWLAPALAVACSELYVLSAALNNALGMNAGFLNLFWFNLGELFVAASGILWWWFLARRRAPRRASLLGIVPALIFTVAFLVNPSMTGILAIWSTGVSLYLPWVVYGLSIWGASVTFFVFLRADARVSIALGLLAAGGLAPQLSAHAFLSLLGLWLLAIADIAIRPMNPSARASDLARAPSEPLPQP